MKFCFEFNYFLYGGKNTVPGVCRRFQLAIQPLTFDHRISIIFDPTFKVQHVMNRSHFIILGLVLIAHKCVEPDEQLDHFERIELAKRSTQRCLLIIVLHVNIGSGLNQE